MRHANTFLLAAGLVAASLAAGCGGSGAQDKGQSVREGAIFYRDALTDNRDSWLVGGRDGVKMFFADGRYQWRIPPKLWPAAASDALAAKHIPAGLAVSVAVEMRGGAALRVVTCRETVNRDGQPTTWYDLGVDGRQALIRRMGLNEPPRVLARSELAVANGRRVRLTGYCVPNPEGGLVLALRVNGRDVARAVDPKPLAAVTAPSIRAYPRPDTSGPATIAWDHFEVRPATLG